MDNVHHAVALHHVGGSHRREAAFFIFQLNVLAFHHGRQRFAGHGREGSFATTVWMPAVPRYYGQSCESGFYKREKRKE